MGNLRVSNDVLLVKTEATYNTDSVPTAATNAMLVQNPGFAPEGLRMNERNSIRGSLGRPQSVFGGELRKITFEAELKGSGTAGTAPEMAAALRACGLGETIVASTSVTYRPISTTFESVTIYWYEGGRKLHKLTGARGNVEFRLTAGGLALAAFEFTGHYSGPTDAAQPTPTVSQIVPVSALGMALQIGGVSVVAREFSVGLGNTIALPPSLASVDGYSEIQITARDVAGSITVESELSSFIDVDLQLRNGSGLTFTSGLLGSTAGNRVNIASAANGLYYRDMGFGDGDGLRLRTIPVAFKETASLNDELAVAFT